MDERVLQFGLGKALVGILTLPERPPAADNPGVILLNAGLLHRVGPHRMYVQFARRLALDGYAVLRFDFSGLGDSSFYDIDMAYEERIVKETQLGVNVLQEAGHCSAAVLIGFCSSATAAFRTCQRDTRIIGAVLINGSFLSDQQLDVAYSHLSTSTQARYYRHRLGSMSGWRRFFSGKTNYRHLIKTLHQRVARQLVAASDDSSAVPIARELWEPFSTCHAIDLALLYSEGSMALDIYNTFFKGFLNSCAFADRISIKIFPGVDHVFTPLWSQEKLLASIQQWLASPARVWNK